jgi:hypothetical protein
MKWHRTKEECFDEFTRNTLGRNISIAEAFYAGWYNCADEINNGYDSDDLQEQLETGDFLIKENPDNDL